MKPKSPIIVVSIVLLSVTLACSLLSGPPTPTPLSQDAVYTQAVQTVIAQLTANAAGNQAVPTAGGETVEAPAVSAEVPPTSTETQVPTNTNPPVPPTNTPIPCNQAKFIKDVSIPDGTKIQVGTGFTKTWRLRNTGSCTWTSAYQLIFDHGDQMGGPLTQPLAGNVAPGQEVDISVNLVAPASPGTYKGFWQLRDPGGVVFGVSTGAFWVQVKAIQPTPTPSPTVPALPPPVGAIFAPVVAGESGSVRSNGTVFGFVNVGDNESNQGQQGFVSFDISALPPGATILSVHVNFSGYDTLGNPFALGCLRMYPQNYGSVDAGDYYTGSTSGAVVRWCNAGELSNSNFEAPSLVSKIQSSVGNNRVRFRLQFNEMQTNGDGAANMVRFNNSLQLIISFTVP
ncbi:MAG: NBR1-Ig-like domain-containing protein [Chloroflexota bacterium]